MNTATPAQLAKYIKGRENVLLFAGYLCDEMELNGKKLSDYAGDLALKVDIPVAATGNSITALRQKGARASKKVGIALVEMLRDPEWRDPVSPRRPDTLLFIGYPREMARALVCASTGVDTVVLGNTEIEEATYCLPESSQREYGRNLEILLKKLGE